MKKSSFLLSFTLLALLLCSCSLIYPGRKEEEATKLRYAMSELASVKVGLGMFHAESEFPHQGYPSTEDITSYDDLKNVLSPYIRLPDEDMASFTFISFTSERPITFVLVARAKDRRKTTITVTPIAITHKF